MVGIIGSVLGEYVALLLKSITGEVLRYRDSNILCAHAKVARSLRYVTITVNALRQVL